MLFCHETCARSHARGTSDPNVAKRYPSNIRFNSPGRANCTRKLAALCVFLSLTPVEKGGTIMFTRKKRVGVVCLVALALLFVLTSSVSAQSRIVLGEPTGRIVSARNDQPLYDVYVVEGRGLMLFSSNLVLQVDGINPVTQSMSFTGYNHVGVRDRPDFWMRKYRGNLTFPGPATTGWLNLTMHYIGDRPYPMTSPNSIEIRFVPR